MGSSSLIDPGHETKLRYSASGKLNVVKVAMSERLTLNEETFVRKRDAVRSYGTLVALDYSPKGEGRTIFPDAA